MGEGHELALQHLLAEARAEIASLREQLPFVKVGEAHLRPNAVEGFWPADRDGYITIRFARAGGAHQFRLDPGETVESVGALLVGKPHGQQAADDE